MLENASAFVVAKHVGNRLWATGSLRLTFQVLGDRRLKAWLEFVTAIHNIKDV
jgi:hypothetical protein